MWYTKQKSQKVYTVKSTQNHFLRDKSKRALRDSSVYCALFLGWVMCPWVCELCVLLQCALYLFFAFTGYSILTINLKENSIHLWNKNSLPFQSHEVVTVTSFLWPFQRYPIHRQAQGWRVCVWLQCVRVGGYAHICAQKRQKK